MLKTIIFFSFFFSPFSHAKIVERIVAWGAQNGL